MEKNQEKDVYAVKDLQHWTQGQNEPLVLLTTINM